MGFFFFSTNSQVKSTKKNFEEFCKDLPTWEEKKKIFSRASKMPVSAFCEYIFLKKDKDRNKKTQAVNG